MDIGKAIKKVRKQSLMNQFVFASKIGITQSYLSNIENNVKKPSMDIIDKICEFTGTPAAVIFWFTLSEEDVQENKREVYNMVKPTIDNLIRTFLIKETEL